MNNAILVAELRPLQASVLVSEVRHLCHYRYVHATELDTPLIKRGIADPALSAYVRNRRAAFASFNTAMIRLSVNRYLFFAETSHLISKNSIFGNCFFVGDYRYCSRHSDVRLRLD